MPKKNQPRRSPSVEPRPVKASPVAGSISTAPDLFGRIAEILDQARRNVVRAVNVNMVTAYWLIGREIVQEIQGGKGRAAYGKQVLADLSRKLTERYGPGFSETNLKHFRTFYVTYPIRHPAGDELPASTSAKPRPAGAESATPTATAPQLAIRHPAGDESNPGFSPQLGWSHYRALMRVESPAARAFYETEAIAGAWDKRTLERQIHSSFYERLLTSQQPARLRAEGRALVGHPAPAIDTLKAPYVLEFLGLPEVAALHESDLETAILSRLQNFLLELGNGFAFVARQKRLRFEDQDRYVDLVFYHCRLKFYLLIDLKLGELTHQDVGQMDGYVRMFDDQVVDVGDNPTIGLILCAEKNEAVARYSVLKDRKQIFASKYMLCLPTEAALIQEIQRERRLLDETTDSE
jgi:predicted nuclease of restriction endonuclease-like (RecB) superfamily